MEDGLVHPSCAEYILWRKVLILVVVEDGLVPDDQKEGEEDLDGLNPCCSGRWSRTHLLMFLRSGIVSVLILVVVEDGLVHNMSLRNAMAITKS